MADLYILSMTDRQYSDAVRERVGGGGGAVVIVGGEQLLSRVVCVCQISVRASVAWCRGNIR